MVRKSKQIKGTEVGWFDKGILDVSLPIRVMVRKIIQIKITEEDYFLEVSLYSNITTRSVVQTRKQSDKK